MKPAVSVINTEKINNIIFFNPKLIKEKKIILKTEYLTNLNENEYINFNPNSLFDIYPKETLYTCEINIRPNTPFNFSACTERGLFELIKLISFDTT